MPKKQKLYTAVYNDLIAKIKDETYRVGGKIPGEIDLARRYGVSRITVARALKDLEHINLIYRVKKGGTFVNGKINTSNTQLIIPVILPFTENFNSIAESIQAAALHSNTFVPLFNSHGNIKREHDILTDILNTKIDGLIVYPCAAMHNINLYAELRRARIPIVCIDRSVDGIDLPLVTSDNERGMLSVVDHLFGLGYRKIGFFFLHNNMALTETERFKGFIKGMVKNNLEIKFDYLFRHDIHKAEQNLSLSGQNILFSEYVKRCVSSYLETVDRPEAIVCVNDVNAHSLYEEMSRRGARIPGDLFLTGFDAASFTKNLFPGFATVSQSFADLGRAALQLMLDILNGKPYESVIRIGVTLVIQ